MAPTPTRRQTSLLQKRLLMVLTSRTNMGFLTHVVLFNFFALQLEHCPNKMDTDICFKCGSTEHTSTACRKTTFPGKGEKLTPPGLLQLVSATEVGYELT